MMRQVNVSMATSRCASSKYCADAVVPMTIEMVMQARKTSMTNQPYLSISDAAMPKP